MVCAPPGTELFALFRGGSEPGYGAGFQAKTPTRERKREPLAKPAVIHDPSSTVRLFVYGTLLPDHCNHQRIVSHVRSAQTGTIQGILVDLGAFPALVPGDGIVRGVALDMDAEALRISDHIEGYHADRRHRLYVREEVQVNLHDGTAALAWTYFFANPEDIADRPRLEVGRRGDKSIFEWQGNVDTER